MQPKTLIKLKFLAVAMVLLVIALGINAVLSSNSLKHLYVETIVSRYSVIGSDLRRNLEKALFFRIIRAG